MFKLILTAAAVSCATGRVACASERLVTSTFPEACQLVRSAPEISLNKCPGPGRYHAWLVEIDQYDQVAFSQSVSKTASDEGLSWVAAEIGVGGAVEWHMANGVPFAALVDTWRRDNDGQGAVEEILIAKTAPASSCRIGTVDARLPNAMNIARRIADTLAEKFHCERDKPIIQAGSAAAGEPKLPVREAVDHNGSIMTLTRSADHSVAIQYELPRPKLPVPQQAVLFRGMSDGRGHLSGTAYTFKRGCEAAPYQVQGAEIAGIITLTGAAPTRDRESCKILGYTNNSENARLVFYQDAVSGFQ